MYSFISNPNHQLKLTICTCTENCYVTAEGSIPSVLLFYFFTKVLGIFKSNGVRLCLALLEVSKNVTASNGNKIWTLMQEPVGIKSGNRTEQDKREIQETVHSQGRSL